MNRKIICLFCALFFLLHTDAQEQRRVGPLKSSPLIIKDSLQLFHHLNLVRESEETNADSAMSRYYRILLSCIANKYERGTDSTLMYMHRRYWKRGASRHAFNVMKAALGYAGQMNASAYLLAHVSNDLGIYALYKSRYEEAASYFNYSLERLKDSTMEQQSLLLSIYNNLGSLWGIMHEDNNALLWFRKAEVLAAKLKEYDLLASITVNIGATYVNKEEWDTAFIYSRRAMEIAEQHNVQGTYSTANLNLAQISLQRNAPREALKYIDNGLARSIAETEKSKRGGMMDSAILPNHMIYYYYEGWAYYLLKEYNKAKEKLLFALEKQKKYGFRGDAMQTMQMLDRTYAALGDYKAAYRYHMDYAAIKDSLDRIEKAKAVEVEIKYRTAEKDRAISRKQLQLTKAENKIQRRNILVIAVSSGALLFIAFVLSLYRSNRNKQKLQTERIRLLQQEHEIGNLKSMMKGEEKERVRLARELHDGIMVQLSTIKMKLRMLQKTQKAAHPQNELKDIMSQLDNATRELRQTAHNLMPDMLLEGGLAEAVFYFCRSLHNGDLQISFQQYGEIPRLQQEFEIALYRMVQELVQNVIKHAHATKALIQLNYRDDLLCITVEDNGKGFDITGLAASRGMGLKSLRTRIRALHGIMDIKSSQETGTAINLEFDIRSVIASKTGNYAY